MVAQFNAMTGRKLTKAQAQNIWKTVRNIQPSVDSYLQANKATVGPEWDKVELQYLNYMWRHTFIQMITDYEFVAQPVAFRKESAARSRV
jgi:hypothetical protein